VRWSSRLPERGVPLLAKGGSLLRTHCTETDPAQRWPWYLRLTQAEGAFGSATPDTDPRPVDHPKTARAETHRRVCFLPRALWRTLDSWRNAKGSGS
jgi:hypothetical protein